MPIAFVPPCALIVPRLAMAPETETPEMTMPVLNDERSNTLSVPLFVTLPVTVLARTKMPMFETCCAVALIEPPFLMLPVMVLLRTSTPAAPCPVAEIVEVLTMSPVTVELEIKKPAPKLTPLAVIVPELVIAACVPPATVDLLTAIPVAPLFVVTVIAFVFAIPPEEIVLRLTKIPSRALLLALLAFVVIVPLFTMPWPIVLFVTLMAAVTLRPTKLDSAPGVTVPALLTAPERLEALTITEVTVVFAGLLTEVPVGLFVTDIPPAHAGRGAPRRSAATQVLARRDEARVREANERFGKAVSSSFANRN